MKTGAADIKQEELALSSIASHKLFPGRTVIRVAEVAKHLEIDEKQVTDLIEEYRDTNGERGLLAINVANGLACTDFPKGNQTPRNHWRIPVSAFDAFVNARKNNQTEPSK